MLKDDFYPSCLFLHLSLGIQADLKRRKKKKTVWRQTFLLLLLDPRLSPLSAWLVFGTTIDKGNEDTSLKCLYGRKRVGGVFTSRPLFFRTVRGKETKTGRKDASPSFGFLQSCVQLFFCLSQRTTAVSGPGTTYVGRYYMHYYDRA